MAIEIDENEYAELKRVAEIAKKIGANPQARQRLQEAYELVDPENVSPEIMIRREVTDRLGKFEEKFSEFLDSQKKERDEREASSVKSKLEQQWLDGRRIAREAGYTDEGLETLETWMEREGVASHKVAIPAFEKENPPPEPVVSGSANWNFFDQRDKQAGDEAFKALMNGDDDTWLSHSINATLKEARGR